VILTKRQKTGIVFLSMALLALVVDRVVLSGGWVPAGASASSNKTPAEHVLEPVDVSEEESQPPTIRLSQRLEMLWAERSLDINQAKDIFTLPECWRSDVFPAETDDIPPPKKDAIKVFITSHRLQAVVISDQTCCATVNGYNLCLGDELDGFKLVAIEDDSATFESGKRRAIIELENDL
jgi:hypothetical protein